MNQAEGGNVIFKFKGDSTDLNKKTNEVSNSFKGMTKSLLTATGITKAVSAGINLITNSVDSAIARVDTLNNFPNVMKNLGIATEESQKQIDRMADKLTGLPTTLDQGAMAVQRFTSANGDVKKSTDIFLALNNAILAGGASADIQANALEQMSQAYAKGKPDMMEWRSLMTAMPAQLNQVAKAMGYVDAATLGEAVRADGGEEAFRQMMETIVQLNETGIDGFANFEDQARASTNGIGTSIVNMKSRVTQGVSAMINAVNEGLKSNGINGLAEVFEKIGNTIRASLISLSPYITKTISILVKNLPKVISFIKTFSPILIPIITAFKAYQEAVTAITTATKLWNVAQDILNGKLLLNPIGLIIAGIAAVIAIIALLWVKCEWFRNLVTGLFTGAINFFKNNWQGILLFLINPFAGAFKLIYDNCEGFRNFINNLVNTVIGFFRDNWKSILLFLVNPFAGAFKLLYDNCEGFRNFVNGFINTVVGFFKSIPGKLVSMAQGIINVFASIPGQLLGIGRNMAQGLWNGLSGMKDWVISKVRAMGQSILNSLKKVLGIHSPSTEMAWMAKMSVVGYTDQLDRMKSQLQNAIDGTFAISPQLANSTSMHYSPNIVVNNEMNMTTDPLGQVVGSIKTFANGAKNDYNYGMGA